MSGSGDPESVVLVAVIIVVVMTVLLFGDE